MQVITNKCVIAAVSLLLCSCAAEHNVSELLPSNGSDVEPLVWENPSESAQKLLFVSNQDGNREIYTVGYDGNNLTRLTHNQRDDYGASWSPSGDKIVFTSNRDGGNAEVYLMNADGSHQINLSQHKGFDGRASWSPDGKSIVFNSDREGADMLYLYSLENGQIRPLSTAGVSSTAEAKWSPDGQWIAFQGFNPANKSDVWIVSADGNSLHQLTNNPKSEDSSVSWSPDGRKLAYHSRRDYRYNIYVYDLDLNKESQFTHLSTSDVDPKWSHDGKQLLFLSTRGRFGRTQLCIMQEDGTQQRCLTDERYQTADAIWLDNDQGILHSNWFGTRYSNIALFDISSAQLIAVSPAKGYQNTPQPSPDVLPNNLSSQQQLFTSREGVRRNQ